MLRGCLFPICFLYLRKESFELMGKMTLERIEQDTTKESVQHSNELGAAS